MPKTEYEKGYEDGFNDGTKICQSLYSKILDCLFAALQRKEDKKKICTKRRKEIEKSIRFQKTGREHIIINTGRIANRPVDNNIKVGDVVFTKSHVVLDIGLVKSVNPLRIYSRRTSFDLCGEPSEFGGVEYCQWYNSGVNISMRKWTIVSLDVGAEDVCKRLGISYFRK